MACQPVQKRRAALPEGLARLLFCSINAGWIHGYHLCVPEVSGGDRNNEFVVAPLRRSQHGQDLRNQVCWEQLHNTSLLSGPRSCLCTALLALVLAPPCPSAAHERGCCKWRHHGCAGLGAR